MDEPDTTSGDEPGSGDVPRPNYLRQVARDLWPQKSRLDPASSPSGRSAKEIVNRIDRREIILGAALAIIAAGFMLTAYTVAHHSSVKLTREEASTNLIAGLISVGLMVLGVTIRRRALLGFGAFLTGLEFLSGGFHLGAIAYLAFGGWLIYRVLQKQKQDRALGLASAPSRAARRPATLTSQPKASKRYTPPKRTSSSGRRR